jgi:hypothetical protein
LKMPIFVWLHTIVTTHNARQIFFKVWAWVVFFILVTVADVMPVFTLPFGAWYSHAHVRVRLGDFHLFAILALCLPRAFLF